MVGYDELGMASRLGNLGSDRTDLPGWSQNTNKSSVVSSSYARLLGSLVVVM